MDKTNLKYEQANNGFIIMKNKEYDTRNQFYQQSIVFN